MKSSAERQRDYRARLKSRAVRDGVTDDSPTPDQAVAVARRALAVARAHLAKAATVEDANTATLAAERALKIVRIAEGLVERSAMEEAYSRVVQGVEQQLAVLADPSMAAALMTAAATGGPDGVRARLRGELDRLAAAVPGELL